MAVVKIAPTPVPSKCGTFKVQKVKKGHKLYGEVRTYPSGQKIYWAKRRPDEIFVKFDAWAVDVETINELSARCVKFIGIEVTNGDRYLTTLANFKDRDLGAVCLNYANHVGTSVYAKGKRGALQWYLPLYAFSKQLAPVAVRVMTAAALMKV
jgi:hypothetical protein